MELPIGNNYEMNKMLVEQKEKALSPNKLNEAKKKVALFISNTENKYYMLLCRERNDYTIFKTNQTVEGNQYNATVMVEEVAQCRGTIKGIDLTEDNSAIEIWISISGESYVYYFFPCDTCVIDEV